MRSGRRISLFRVLACSLLVSLLLVAVPQAPVLADEARYPDADIETWLRDGIAATEVTILSHPSVAFDADGGEMIVENLAFEVRGIRVGVSRMDLALTGVDTTTSVVGELDLMGTKPRFWCDIEFAFQEADGELQVASVSNVRVADFTPDLSSADLEALADCLNVVLEASGLSITAPAGDMQTIGIVDDGGVPRLVTTWSGGHTAHLEAQEIEDALGDMAGTLAQKANDYLGAEPAEWSVDVTAVDDLLKVTVQLSIRGKDVTLSVELAFDGPGFSCADSTLVVGSETVAFSCEGDVSASNYVPALNMTAFSLADDHPRLRDFIAETEAAVLNTLNDLYGTVVEATGLTLEMKTVTGLSLDGDALVVEGASLVEGDVTMDGTTNIVDAMFIAQYTVGLRTLTPDQMRAGDTTDDGKTNIVDAMHVAQYTVDPYGTANVLFKPLWEKAFDETVTVNPLTL